MTASALPGAALSPRLRAGVWFALGPPPEHTRPVVSHHAEIPAVGGWPGI